MHYYPHNIGDFDKATRHLTRIERSIYRDMIEIYYDTESKLTLDIKSLCRIVLARTDEEITAVEQMLNEFFIQTVDGWFHERCETELEKYKTNISQKAKAGIASALAREVKHKQTLDGKATPIEQPLNGRATKQELELELETRTRNKKQELETLKPKSNTLPPDKSGGTEMQSACRLTWKHFTNAYFKRYNIEPVKNAKVFSVIKLFVARIGFADAPYVAEFFVNHNERFYVQRSHPVDSMLKDCEGLRTQWATNRPMTSTQAHQLDKTASNFDSIQQAKLMMRSRDENR
jgi:uncharacterized protein YdaU (DUF1376 family)